MELTIAEWNEKMASPCAERRTSDSLKRRSSALHSGQTMRERERERGLSYLRSTYARLDRLAICLQPSKASAGLWVEVTRLSYMHVLAIFATNGCICQALGQIRWQKYADIR